MDSKINSTVYGADSRKALAVDGEKIAHRMCVNMKWTRKLIPLPMVQIVERHWQWSDFPNQIERETKTPLFTGYYGILFYSCIYQTQTYLQQTLKQTRDPCC